MKYIDLHTHTTGSDGTFTPSELVKAAKEAGLSAVAITDHDSTDGVPEGIAAGIAEGIEVVPGVELSTDYEGDEIHVVGLYIDIENPELKRELAAFRENRVGRNEKMCELLRREGFDISVEAMKEGNPDVVITRGNFAGYLLKTGQIKDSKILFDEYIGNGCKCYVERYKITPMRAVEIILGAGGVPILAHPCMYKISDEKMFRMINDMKRAGLIGIEVIYSRNKEGDEEKYRKIANDFELIPSGGSDFHGANKPDISIGTGEGNLRIPMEFLDEIKRHKK